MASLEGAGSGTVTWVDLQTPDLERAGRFYFADPTGALFGVWQGRAHRGPR